MIRRLSANDTKLVDDFIKDKEMYKALGDEGAPLMEELTMKDVLSNQDNYILGYFKDKLIGMVCFYKFNHISYATHIAVKKPYRGNVALNIAKASIDWITKNTNCRKLIAIFPSINISARVIAIKCGFSHEGTIKKSFQRDGKIYNQYVFGKEV